jgi:ATP-binding cassette subfamily B protein
MSAREYTDFTLFKRLVIDAKKHWRYIVGIIFIDLVATPLSLLSPLPLKIVVDSVIGDRQIPITLAWFLPDFINSSTMGILFFAIALLILTSIFVQLQALFAVIVRLHAAAKLTLDFRSRLFWHGQTLSLAYHDSKGVTHTLYRILYDANAGQRVLLDGVISMATAFITLISMLVVISLINIKLAIVALMIVPILVLLIRNYRMPLREGWRHYKHIDNLAASIINEVFSSLRVVKAYTQEEKEYQRYTDRALDSLESEIQVNKLEGIFGLATGVVTACGTGAVLYIGVQSIQTGQMSVGDMLVVMSYLTLLYGPLSVIGRRLASMQDALTSAERVYSFLDEDSDVPEKLKAIPIDRLLGEFRISNLTFGYLENQNVLENVNLTIPSGAKVGIVGKTGSGKTTFLNLLMRFYDPQVGKIFIDGIDIKDLRVLDLRRQFGLVLQEPVLFSNSILENIAYGKANSSDEEIISAAQAANADEFIEKLSNGYQTLVGEKGMRLSGGQRQRVALARTFLKDAPILLLDEPTSSVDVGTEKLIMSAISRLMKKRTTFIIAHRLSTLDGCDMILHFSNGSITVIEREEVKSFLKRIELNEEKSVLNIGI